MSNIFIQHTRALGYCRKGAKKFLERHGFNWEIFLSKGIPEEELMKIDDVMVMEVIKYMRREANVGR